MWKKDIPESDKGLIDRRKFLWRSAALLSIPVVNTAAGFVDSVNAALNAEDIAEMYKKIEESEKLAWKFEINFFKEFFEINDENFVSTVEQIQMDLWISVDGILGRETLKKVYLEFYWENIKKLPKEIRNNLKKLQESEESLDKNYFISQSIKASWKTEIDFFKSFFKISDAEFEQKVKDIQQKFGHTDIDWVIGWATLRDIYLNYYAKNINLLSPEIKYRLSIHKELMDWYRKKKEKFKINVFYEKLNVFSKNTYYGWWWWINKAWTYINEDLYGKIPNIINSKKNQIIISDLNWQKILKFYVWWKLHLASHVSPWLTGHRTPAYLKVWDLNPDDLHVSSSYPEAHKTRSWKKWWAIMPYAVNVAWAIRIHWSDWRIDWKPASHGCVRLPLFYAKELYEMLMILWKNNVTIDTRNIY